MYNYVKCPDCGEKGHQYLGESRRRFHCPFCGLNTYLKLIGTYVKDETPEDETSKDETPEHKRQSIETES